MRILRIVICGLTYLCGVRSGGLVKVIDTSAHRRSLQKGVEKMSIFEDLRSEYKTARETSLDYYRRCEMFARHLSIKLTKYLGAPEYFTDQKGETTPYVETVGVEEQEDGSYKSTDRAGYMELIHPDESGYWLTGLKVILDVAPNTWPKSGFLFLIRFIIKDNKCELYVADSKEAITFDIGDPNGLNAPFDIIVRSFKLAFTRKPWEQKKKTSIGFVELDSK
jgi:hypothetical protein